MGAYIFGNPRGIRSFRFWVLVLCLVEEPNGAGIRKHEWGESRFNHTTTSLGKLEVKMKSEVSNRESLAAIQEAMGEYNVSVAVKKGFKAFAKFARSEAGVEIWFSVIECWVIHVGPESECKAFSSDFNSVNFDNKDDADLFAAAPETAAERDRLKAENAELVAEFKRLFASVGGNHNGRVPTHSRRKAVDRARAFLAKIETSTTEQK